MGGGGSSGPSRSSRDFMPIGRRDPMPLPPSLGGSRGLGNSSLRGSGGGGVGAFESVFSRRSPPRSGNGMGRFR